MAVASAASMAGAAVGGGFGGGGFGGAGRGGYAAELAALATALVGLAALATVMWMSTHNVTVGGGWGHYGAGAVAAGAVAGAVAGLAIGATIASLPAAAQPLDVGGQTYYYDGTNYYQPCAQGSDMNYCVVSDPN